MSHHPFSCHDPYFPLNDSYLPSAFLESPNILGLNSFYYCSTPCSKILYDDVHVCRSPKNDGDLHHSQSSSVRVTSEKVCKGLLGDGDSQNDSEPGLSSSNKKGRRLKRKGFRGPPVVQKTDDED